MATEIRKPPPKIFCRTKLRKKNETPKQNFSFLSIQNFPFPASPLHSPRASPSFPDRYLFIPRLLPLRSSTIELSLTKLVRVSIPISYEVPYQSRTSLLNNFVRLWSMKVQHPINKGAVPHLSPYHFRVTGWTLPGLELS